MRRISILSFAAVFVLAYQPGCHPKFQPTSLQYAAYDVNQQATDSAYIAFIKPYADKVGETMNNPVGELPLPLVKALPDGSLGNFMADAYLAMAREKFDPSAEVAYMNHGGIRLNQVQAGTLRRGTVYEVMPFDNLMVILKVKGSLLRQFLDHIAEEGGGGIAGVQMNIRDKKAINIRIKGQPLDTEATYTMVNSDYVVNGGGRFTGFKDLPAQKTGYLLRDAILDYCERYKAAGKPIPVSTEKRIVHEQP
ncbi:MAG: 5'-nucleotidase C-terminal domain-containing protein [Chitinophagaceae bacterium]|jgi:2',3'-cyclic-nucleotide 2'-phosphodiesterase (5'-nucleotidase family)|nr:5'-nucleotidase C-terminal domain-containing protein [Chitinophagaceae bacterium]